MDQEIRELERRIREGSATEAEREKWDRRRVAVGDWSAELVGREVLRLLRRVLSKEHDVRHAFDELRRLVNDMRGETHRVKGCDIEDTSTRRRANWGKRWVTLEHRFVLAAVEPDACWLAAFSKFPCVPPPRLLMPPGDYYIVGCWPGPAMSAWLDAPLEGKIGPIPRPIAEDWAGVHWRTTRDP